MGFADLGEAGKHSEPNLIRQLICCPNSQLLPPLIHSFYTSFWKSSAIAAIDDNGANHGKHYR